MFFFKPLDTCRKFITQVNESLQSIGARQLSAKQQLWLSLCITGVLVTNSVCWKWFERSCFGKYKANTISKMFCRTKVFWDTLLLASVHQVIKTYGITHGVLALDGTDNKRSKNTKKISKVHKLKDKASGGYIMGQELTFLVLITDKVTIPVGFEFYEPDPKMSQWYKANKAAKAQGIPKANRPQKPVRNAAYPTQTEVALRVLNRFKENFTDITVKVVLADAYYGSKAFFKNAQKIYKHAQIISQVKKTQLVKARNGSYKRVEAYFNSYPGVEQTISIRGEAKKVVIHGARLRLKAHGQKRFIIALKYEGETEYRYLVASMLTWRLTDIASAYTLRWLVEVFIQDWKSYEGWCKLAKQPGDDGTRKGVILSLLTDHCLLLHEDQKALIKNKLPASTVGSLRDRERANAMLEALGSVIQDKEHSKKITSELQHAIQNVIPLRPSKKHMSDKIMPNLESAPSLAYQAAA
jgi:hypothetical protein